MDQIIDRRMTTQEARKWLVDVARREREKIGRLKFTRRVLSEDPQDDLAHDVATAKAWQFLKEEGLHANPQALIQALPDDLARKTQLALGLARRDLTSLSRQKIVLRDAEQILGYQPETAADRVQLLALLIAGKAEAWKSRAALEAPDPALPSPQTKHMAVPQSKAAPEPLEASAPAVSPELSDIVARMCALKRSEGIEEKTLRSYQTFAHLFTTLTGVSDVRCIRQNNVCEFRAMLHRLPKSWGKSPRDHI